MYRAWRGRASNFEKFTRWYLYKVELIEDLLAGKEYVTNLPPVASRQISSTWRGSSSRTSRLRSWRSGSRSHGAFGTGGPRRSAALSGQSAWRRRPLARTLGGKYAGKLIVRTSAVIESSCSSNRMSDSACSATRYSRRRSILDRSAGLHSVMVASSGKHLIWFRTERGSHMPTECGHCWKHATATASQAPRHTCRHSEGLPAWRSGPAPLAWSW